LAKVFDMTTRIHTHKDVTFYIVEGNHVGSYSVGWTPRTASTPNFANGEMWETESAQFWLIEITDAFEWICSNRDCMTDTEMAERMGITR
jgi:hypothetical protein